MNGDIGTWRGEDTANWQVRGRGVLFDTQREVHACKSMVRPSSGTRTTHSLYAQEKNCGNSEAYKSWRRWLQDLILYCTVWRGSKVCVTF